MNRVRCAICRQCLPTLKTLKSHYTTSHSKIQIVKELLKNTIINAHGPAFFAKSKKRKYKTIYLNEELQITCSDDMIVIDDESSSDLIEVTFDEQTTKRRPKRAKKRPKKLLHIGIRKIQAAKSLDEHSGEFYECHCMERSFQKMSSDTESCSDAGKSFYCSYCGNGYQSVAELTGHEKLHQFYCRICNQALNPQNYKEHIEQHLIRIYICHLCGFEFIRKEVLLAHLMHHFEQQTFENILNMEQDYNMYGFCNTNFSAGDYYSNINNILFFLTYPYDHYYSRNMFMKVVCDICYQEFYVYDYERHLKIAHFFN